MPCSRWSMHHLHSSRKPWRQQGLRQPETWFSPILYLACPEIPCTAAPCSPDILAVPVPASVEQLFSSRLPDLLADLHLATMALIK